jgi:hypothetical protein
VTVERPIFVLRLRPEKGIDPIRALRNVLKELLRRHGMKCMSIDQRVLSHSDESVPAHSGKIEEQKQ